MLASISAKIIFFARNVKTQGTPKPKRPQNMDKIKFTEEQLTKMGPKHHAGKPSIREMFTEKYAEKFKQFQEHLESPSKPRKVKTKDKKYSFYNKPINKHSEKADRLQPDEMTLSQMASVRLGIQYLPISYLKQAQKIFHKYGQVRLRHIADDYTNLMKLRYSEQKLNFDEYQNLGFLRIEQKIPKEKQIEQIYLIGQQKIYDEEDNVRKQTRKIDEQAFDVALNYTQNIAVSYLLKRAPRTFASAVRIMTEIKYKYPDFTPTSFLDFGAGLASGATAFIDIFEDTKQVYCVQPASKMRKLGKYLTQGNSIKYYESLGEMTVDVKQVDIAYAGYVLDQIKPELVEVYLEALYSKVKNEGFLAIVQYGTPYGSRMIHQTRKWAIQKGMYIAAPCPHHHKCPLRNSKNWCHFDQPSGVYPSQIFGKLPTDQDVRLEKYSYLILQKKQKSDAEGFQKNQPNLTKDWDRVIFPTMKRGRHTVLNLCTKDGLYERRISAKSHGPQYKQVKKLKWGDYWRFGKRIPHKFRKQRKTGLRLW